jgi:hypothetical protein
MSYIPIELVPTTFRELIVESGEENSRTVEALKKEYAEAERNRRFERTNQITAQMAQHLRPTNPAFKLVGGHGGYILIDEKRFSEWRKT